LYVLPEPGLDVYPAKQTLSPGELKMAIYQNSPDLKYLFLLNRLPHIFFCKNQKIDYAKQKKVVFLY